MPARRGRGAGGGLPNRRRGDRLDQIVAHPRKQELAAAPGRAVGADRDHGGSHLADFGQFVDAAGRVGHPVDVDDHKARRAPAGKRRDGCAEPAAPDLGIVVYGRWLLVVQQPLSKGVLGFRIHGEGEQRGGPLDPRRAQRFPCVGVDFGDRVSGRDLGFERGGKVPRIRIPGRGRRAF